MTPPVSNLEDISSCSKSSSSIDDIDQADESLETSVSSKQNQTTNDQQTRELGEFDDSNDLSEFKTRTELETLSEDQFEPLPKGWLKVEHHSGMPLYLHRESRVCTVSKPYYLGEGSVRKHDVPVSAIPCLEYCREKSKAAPDSDATVTEEKQRPPLPDDTKLIPLPSSNPCRASKRALHTPPEPVIKSQEKGPSIRTPEMPKLKSKVYRELKY